MERSEKDVAREAAADLGGGQVNPGDQAPPGTPGTGETICGRCGGSGRQGAGECPSCGGTGRVIEGISAGA